MSLRIKSKIQVGRYNILVHYYQPSHGKYNGRIIVESGRSTALYLKIKHCPNVGGCRAIARDKLTDTSRSLYINGDVDITISITLDNEIWIVSICFFFTYLLLIIIKFQNSITRNCAIFFIPYKTTPCSIIPHSKHAWQHQTIRHCTTQYLTTSWPHHNIIPHLEHAWQPDLTTLDHTTLCRTPTHLPSTTQ